MAGSTRGSDDGRATLAESNRNFTDGIFQMIASELPASSWQMLSYRKKFWQSIPTVIDVQVAISSANDFSSLELLDVRFCSVVGGAARVLGEDWKSAFSELFAIALGGHTAPSRVERRAEGPSAQGNWNVIEVGLRLGLGLGWIGGQVAEFSTKASLMGNVLTEEKSN